MEKAIEELQAAKAEWAKIRKKAIETRKTLLEVREAYALETERVKHLKRALSWDPQELHDRLVSKRSPCDGLAVDLQTPQYERADEAMADLRRLEELVVQYKRLINARAHGPNIAGFLKRVRSDVEAISEVVVKKPVNEEKLEKLLDTE